MTRERLPNRRDSRTGMIRWPLDTGRRVHVTVGFAEDGRPLEVFLRGGGASGSDIDFLLDDVAILISRLLQHGDTPAALADGVGRSPQGVCMSLVGAVADLLVEMQNGYGAAA